MLSRMHFVSQSSNRWTTSYNYVSSVLQVERYRESNQQSSLQTKMYPSEHTFTVCVSMWRWQRTCLCQWELHLWSVSASSYLSDHNDWHLLSFWTIKVCVFVYNHLRTAQ